MLIMSTGILGKGILPPASDTLPGRKLKLKIEFGLGMAALKTTEYLKSTDEAQDSLGVYYVRNRERILPINGIFGQSSIDAAVSFAIWKELYTGIFYKTNKITGLKRGDNGGLFEENAFFIGVGALVGYDFYPIDKHRNFAAGLQLGMGSYHGPQFYSGTGRQFLIHTEGYARYAFKDRYGLKTYFGQDYISYKEEGISEELGIPTNKKVAFNNFYFGIGLSFKVHLRPDIKNQK